MGRWSSAAFGFCLLFVVAIVLGCTGWFSTPSVERVRYQLVGAGLTPETAQELQEALRVRFLHRGFDDATVTATPSLVTIELDRREGRVTPTRLFEVGELTAHRVDELQSRGSDRVMRQLLEKKELDHTAPPESVWSILREENLLAEDKLAFYSKTSDGRETMVVVQRVAFLHGHLFDNTVQVGDGLACTIESQWSARLLAVVDDPRMTRRRDRIALMVDGDLLSLRDPSDLLNAEKRLELKPPPPQAHEGGRRIWESRENPGDWCRDMTAVLISGPLPASLELKEMKVIPPQPG